MATTCGRPIKVKVKDKNAIFGTTTVRTKCGRPADHTEGSCAPGPTPEDLLKKKASFW